MTTIGLAAGVGTEPSSLGRLFRAPVFTAAGVAILILTLPTLAAMAVDARRHLGVDIWAKPLKFELALALLVLTLSIYARWLPAGVTGRRWYAIYSATVVFAIAGEIAWIAGAAALGTASHFNEATAFSTGVYALMGVFAVYLTGATLVHGGLIARSPEGPRDPALRLGVVAGLVLTFVLTVVFAGTMSANGSHFVGAPAQDAPAGSDTGGLWGMGWSRDGGDLRVAHFFSTHAMHALPLVGFVAGRRLATPMAVALTAVATLAYVGFCVATFAQALAGRPFLPWLG